MAIYQGNVKSYYLCVRTPNAHSAFKAAIHISGKFGLGYMNFVPDGQQLPPNKKHSGRDVFEVHYWMSSWTHCVDLLRYEKPVFFFYDDSSNTAELRTNSEAVGEGEE